MQVTQWDDLVASNLWMRSMSPGTFCWVLKRASDGSIMPAAGDVPVQMFFISHIYRCPAPAAILDLNGVSSKASIGAWIFAGTAIVNNQPQTGLYDATVFALRPGGSPTRYLCIRDSARAQIVWASNQQ